MIRYRSHKQLPLVEFDWPFQTKLDKNNRWINLSECIPWDELAEGYYRGLSDTQGRPTKDARLVIGAVIIKHKLCLSDRETVAQIQENPYLQYFVGLSGYQMEAPFVPSLFVEIRKRMGQSVFDVFQSAIIDAVESAKPKPKAKTTSNDKEGEPPSASGSSADEEAEARQGKLILDATVTPQAIRYPTDLSLLNEARQFSEQIIDKLYPKTDWSKKPRTYRVKARQDYLAIAKPGHERLQTTGQRCTGTGRRRYRNSSCSTDVSIASADIVLISSELEKVRLAAALSRRTLRTIRQNIAISITYNLIMVPLAMMALITPLVAAVSMPVSSLLVIGNAARIRTLFKSVR
ncbi:MAG: transposase [Chromatiaceae bacterium]|nr:transposase [Chromatiaceae bacterium]